MTTAVQKAPRITLHDAELLAADQQIAGVLRVHRRTQKVVLRQRLRNRRAGTPDRVSGPRPRPLGRECRLACVVAPRHVLLEDCQP